MFGHHALGHVEGLFQGAGVTHVERVDLVEEEQQRGGQAQCRRFLRMWMEPAASRKGSPRLAKLPLVSSTNLEAKEVALQPEGDNFQDDAQKNRDDVEDGVDGPLQDLLLVNVLAGCIEVKDGSRNQDCH